MKAKILFSSLLFGLLVAGPVPEAMAQNLTPAQQKELIEQAKLLKEQVHQLQEKDAAEGGAPARPLTGLKTQDMNNTSTEEVDKKKPPSMEGGSLSPEQREELMKNLKKIKENDDASQKELERLMKEND